jgi:hypothetical protein
MHKVEFMISNGQYKRWRHYLRMKWGGRKSLNRMIILSAQAMIADEMFKEEERAKKREEISKTLMKGEEHGKTER